MSAPEFQAIRVERQGDVCSIVLNKPPLNIIDFTMIQEIREALRQLAREESVRVIVFSGAGPKGFSAGVSVQDHAPDRVQEVIPAFDDIFRLLGRSEKITVAAVHGFCFGGGLELAMMCDLVVAAENAQLGQPEIKLGQIAPVGLILLPHLIGYRKAAELLFTGRSIDAREAQSLGLVNQVVSAEQLSVCLEGLVRELTSQSGSILRLTKRALRRYSGLDFEARLNDAEHFFLNEVSAAADSREGIAAFLEKRPACWAHA